MSVYIDSIKNYPPEAFKDKRVRNISTQWCHMIADTKIELIEMARQIGMKEKWVQDTDPNHFDLTPTRRESAIKNGAISLNRKEFILKLREIRGNK